MSSLLLEKPVEMIEEVDEGIERHRWTRTEIYQIYDLGLFDPNSRFELIEGDIFHKMPQKRPHSTAIAKSHGALTKSFGTGSYVSIQSPLNIDEYNAPEPDLMVVAGIPDDYEEQPTPADVKLIVEVADTTLHYDQNTKVRLYARAGIQEYWILVLKARLLVVYRDPGILPYVPTEYGYKSSIRYTEDDSVTPLHAPNVSLRVADLLPLPKKAEG